MTSLRRLVLTGGCTVALLQALATTALAAPVRYELDTESELTSAGFEFNNYQGSSEFTGGMLALHAVGYAEWTLPSDSASNWFGSVDDATGWWVEARIQLLSLPPDCTGDVGPGLWIHDRTSLLHFHFTPEFAGITYPQQLGVPMDATDGYHVYRVQNLGRRHIQVVIDGALVADEPSIMSSAGTESLIFGDLGGCQSSETSWDYFSYDTVAPEPVAGDADGDGIDNALDDCALVDNADQSDADEDGIGDVCDGCPADPLNDQDADTLCADEDVCPADPRNDSDGNGICDTMECEQAGQCLAICGCLGQGGFFGYDPVGGGGFGALDNFGANGGTGFTPIAGSTSSGGQGQGAQGSTPIGHETYNDSGSSGGCGCRLSEPQGGMRGWPLALVALLLCRRSRRAGRAA